MVNPSIPATPLKIKILSSTSCRKFGRRINPPPPAERRGLYTVSTFLIAATFLQKLIFQKILFQSNSFFIYQLVSYSIIPEFLHHKIPSKFSKDFGTKPLYEKIQVSEVPTNPVTVQDTATCKRQVLRSRHG